MTSIREAALRVTAALAAALLVIVLLATFGIGRTDAGAAAFEGDVTLTTDAGASAMFQAVGLAPGTVVSNCVAVTYDGPDTPIELRLQGASSGGLDPYLTLRIEAGTGGGHDDCGGFTGTQRFEGTLASFVADHGSSMPGLLVAETAARDQPVTFRFSLALDSVPEAQGESSTSSYTWLATPAPTDPTPPPADDPPTGGDPIAGDPGSGDPPTGDEPAPGDAPTPDDIPPGDGETDPATGSTPDAPVPPAAPDGPAGAPGEHDPAEDGTVGSPSDGEGDGSDAAPGEDDAAPGDAANGSGHDAGAGDGAVAAPDHLDERARAGLDWGQFAQVVLFIAERSSYLLILLLIVLLFLAIQDRIDRKDPKLALAPREPDLDLRFEPPPSQGGGRR